MPLELRLKFGIGFCGRVHITEVNDNNVLEKPFGNFKVGQTIPTRIETIIGKHYTKIINRIEPTSINFVDFLLNCCLYNFFFSFGPKFIPF
ncbi:hypothetical protein E1A91_D08G255400v1 [Gossypium mustelinum]|uniref:S1 motif domain-containing protein n=1 Tax=Gossypium mustelinum TaxID=34275 RepID=A0A5D2U2J7_GOSMU|nr:hypothetical protein E1A91_D08G255400v1 [Gossypium mustelinum]